VTDVAVMPGRAAYARPMKRIGISLVVAACGSTAQSPDAAVSDGAAADSAASGFVVTSSAFSGGGAIPLAHTCKGANTSPPLTWTGAPAGTASFAVVLTDLSLSPPLVHSVIYDIPATATGLPPGVENAYAPANVPGAHQTESVHAPVIGYYGPCPGTMHTYQFAVHSVLALPLPGSSATTARTDAVALITAHQIGPRPATLAGAFTP
jgi:phosphatidylethanolamine-binding protein (PEBP) family uncharacterized protein